MPDTYADLDGAIDIDVEGTLPDADYPIRRELLGRVGEPGPLGDVALTLAEGVRTYASYDGGVYRYLNRVFGAGPGVYLPIVAAFRPTADMWLEVILEGASPYAVLCGPGPDGRVWLRRLDQVNGRSFCQPVSLLRKPYENPPAIDWEVIAKGRFTASRRLHERWAAWSEQHLFGEFADPAADETWITPRLFPLGIRDLLLAAFTISPLGPRGSLTTAAAQ